MRSYPAGTILGILLNLLIFSQSWAQDIPPDSSLAFLTTAANSETDRLAAPNVAKILGWISDCSKICGGYYAEPTIIASFPHPGPINEEPVSISAKKPALFTQFGTSVLQGDVVIKQPGREVTAEHVTIFRDHATGKISSSTLLGNVHLREYGKLIVSEIGHLHFLDRTFSFSNSIYRFAIPSPMGELNAWGVSKSIDHFAKDIYEFRKGSYSTCPVKECSWKVWSNHLVLNKNTGVGRATNSLFYVRKMPIFYLPYLTFPIDNRRKSGLLFPTFKYSPDSGLDVAFPYYFNLAPNYDLTFTPEPISKRGVMVNGLFRYLSTHSFGSLDVSYIPRDAVFAQFRDDARWQFSPSPALSQLENDHDERGYISFQDQTNFNQHWKASMQANYVTDDYFAQDFPHRTTVNADDNDQLLNQAELNYDGENWHFLGKLLAFQTLHLVNQYPSTAVDQYRRLPQLALNGDYPNSKGGVDYQLSSEFVNFDHSDDFITGMPIVTGTRFNLKPGVSLPMQWIGGYVTPKVELQMTNYQLQNQVQPFSDSITRTLPLFSFDSRVFFNRDLNYLGKSLTQTLEPRLFYVYIPEKNQSDIPIFDTALPVFDFDQLFRVNRFSGEDRIGDANQGTYALTTRFLDEQGQERFNASIGQLLVFHKHEVCINDDCSTDSLAGNRVSPVVGQVQYFMNNSWNSSASVAWDPNHSQLNNSTFKLQYQQADQNVVNFWYNYLLDGDPFPGKSRDLSRAGVSLAWRVSQKWNLIGSLYYNLSQSHPQSYVYGVEYDSCCWALRLVQSRTFLNYDANGKSNFDSSFYAQIMLKGLGNFGTSNAGSLLTNQITGFKDNFAMGPHL